MPSPFPGMNPYLEHPRVWADFHNTYVPALRAELQPKLVTEFYAQIQVHSYSTEWIGSDLEIVHGSKYDDALEERYCYLEIINLKTDKLISVIEVMTPTIKIGTMNRGSYLDACRKHIESGVNVIELDLLRAGKRLLGSALPSCDYCAIVCRKSRSTEAHVWPVELRQTLPTIPIPLTSEAPEVELDLQAVLHRIYDEGGYGHRIYRRSPVPRLTPQDAHWAAEILAAAGITPPP